MYLTRNTFTQDVELGFLLTILRSTTATVESDVLAISQNLLDEPPRHPSQKPIFRKKQLALVLQ